MVRDGWSQFKLESVGVGWNQSELVRKSLSCLKSVRVYPLLVGIRQIELDRVNFAMLYQRNLSLKKTMRIRHAWIFPPLHTSTSTFLQFDSRQEKRGKLRYLLFWNLNPFKALSQSNWIFSISFQWLQSGASLRGKVLL